MSDHRKHSYSSIILNTRAPEREPGAFFIYGLCGNVEKQKTRFFPAPLLRMAELKDEIPGLSWT